MAKKMAKAGMTCPNCGMVNCKCLSGEWCWTLFGLVVVALGLLFIYPVGWFTFEHTLGVLVVLYGLKKVWMSFSGKCH